MGVVGIRFVVACCQLSCRSPMQWLKQTFGTKGSTGRPETATLANDPVSEVQTTNGKQAEGFYPFSDGVAPPL